MQKTFKLIYSVPNGINTSIFTKKYFYKCKYELVREIQTFELSLDLWRMIKRNPESRKFCWPQYKNIKSFETIYNNQDINTKLTMAGGLQVLSE